MLDIKLIEHRTEEVKAKLNRRGDIINLIPLLKLIKTRKQIIHKLQNDQEKRNNESNLLSHTNNSIINTKRLLLKKLNQNIKKNKLYKQQLEKDIFYILLKLPNIPLDEVPSGYSQTENKEIKKIGNPKKFSFKIKDHVKLGKSIGGIDFKRASKISGSRFTFLKGPIAKLNHALLQYFLNFHNNYGDEELATPLIVKKNAMINSGHLPKFKKDVFEIKYKRNEYYLIPTAEVSLINYYANEILDSTQLPIRFYSYTPCFRAEAGAAGKDTHGLIRQHQFEKVEMVRFAKSKQAIYELNLMVERVSKMLIELELPHNIICLCTGDLGFTAQKTIDIEVWLPGQNSYREISSCSICGDFQARRAKIRYRNKSTDKKSNLNFVVTLNGSGLPLGRTLVAILENHQNSDGSINIPKVLQPFMNGLQKIK